MGCRYLNKYLPLDVALVFISASLHDTNRRNISPEHDSAENYLIRGDSCATNGSN